MTCEYCERGHETLCDVFKATRIEPGGFSELILVPARNAALDLLAVPDDVSDAAATAIEPLACGVRALRRARVGADTRLLVVGGGQMGLLVAQAALAAGAAVTVAEPLPERRALAEELGVRARWIRRDPAPPTRRDRSAPARAAAWELAVAGRRPWRRDPALRARRARASGATSRSTTCSSASSRSRRATPPARATRARRSR